MPKKTQRGIWETKAQKLDLKNPRVLKWYVEKKINAGDWGSLSRRMIAQVLPKLNIDRHLRELLARVVYLKRKLKQ